METQRINIFNIIHKSLRAILYDTSILLQQTDFSNEEESETCIKKIESVIRLFASHAHKEDTIILPVIRKYDAVTATLFDSEHGTDEMLSDQVTNKIDALRLASTKASKDKAGRQLYYLFIEFVAFNLIHMNKEECLLNEILWEHYSDAELIELNNTIKSKVSREEMEELLPWMLKGISNMELIEFLMTVKDTAPLQDFGIVFQIAENIPPAERWEKVKEGFAFA